eukprot:scaffold3055_cov143-Cylindrotheca_fusiformis.AAC.4
MKRPSDQAKLLLFALLRSSATALATGEKRLVLQQFQNIQLRLATRSDVPSIQRCNLACLPENYNSQFYCSHLRQWPDLAVVAEDVSEAPRNHSRLPFSNFSPVEPKIVAYVLGKIETRPVVDLNNPTYGNDQVETLGHVTSLAVQDDFRRLGLAQAMMTQLHHHLQHQGIKNCGLHVRTSNEAACRLYQRDGYEIAQIIPSYYQDGEDAYFMRKALNQCSTSSSGQAMLFGKKIWKSGPDELRLPRHHRSRAHENIRFGQSSERPGSSADSGLLTGTM